MEIKGIGIIDVVRLYGEKRVKAKSFLDVIIKLEICDNTCFYDELKRLLIHGLLHLVNYDHERSSYHKKKMKSKETELLEALRHL